MLYLFVTPVQTKSPATFMAEVGVLIRSSEPAVPCSNSVNQLARAASFYDGKWSC